MTTKEFVHILSKFLSQAISSEELDCLNKHLEETKDDSTFRSYVEIDYTTKYLMSKYDSSKAKKELLTTIRHDKKRVKHLQIIQYAKYAAMVVLFLGFAFLYWNHNYRPFTSEKVAIEDQITLRLSDGTVKTISESENSSVYDKKGNRIGLQQGNQLVYHKGGKAKELVYNEVTVPYGKKFTLILSDGTRAHLNAGSSLRYPVEFIKENKRQIFLSGEGYFDVTEDKERPFVINANQLNVRVLGTSFNLSAYPEDEIIRTVLVEGSVGFYEENTDYDERATKLAPGHMAVWDRTDKSMKVSEINTQLFTGWMDGRVIFSHMPFEDIIKKLERNYNVEIENRYKALNKIRFNASFDTETITEVFEAFNKNYPLKFEVVGKKVIIDKP